MSYVIAGRAIKTEWLSIGTLLSTAAITAISMSGGSKKEKAAAVQPEALKVESSSSEEEEFIRNFVAEAEKADRESHSKH